MLYVQIFLASIFTWAVFRWTGLGASIGLISKTLLGMVAVVLVLTLLVAGIGSIFYLTSL